MRASARLERASVLRVSRARSKNQINLIGVVYTNHLAAENRCDYKVFARAGVSAADVMRAQIPTIYVYLRA